MPEYSTICVDVGNTLTHIGLFHGKTLASSWVLTTPAHATADELEIKLRSLALHQVEGATHAILACVVPALADTWTRALAVLPITGRPFVVGPGLKNGLVINMKDPTQVGADRIADCVAAKELYGAPVIVVDLGTTTNINVIGKDERLLGGIIAPGMRSSANAAFSSAAQLYAVTLQTPKSVIGQSTREAMQSGFVFGEACRINGLISAIEAELGCACNVLLTGADAVCMEPLLNHEVRVDQDLTLQGLRLICQKNARK